MCCNFDVGYDFSPLDCVSLIFNKLDSFKWLGVEYGYFEIVLDSWKCYYLDGWTYGIWPEGLSLGILVIMKYIILTNCLLEELNLGSVPIFSRLCVYRISIMLLLMTYKPDGKFLEWEVVYMMNLYCIYICLLVMLA